MVGSRGGRGAMLLAGAAIVIVLGGCGAGGPQRFHGRSQYFGLNAQNLIGFARNGDLGELDRQLASLAATGVGFVRANLNWGLVASAQKPGPQPDFSAYDRWAAALASHRLRWQVTLIGLPTPPAAAEPATWAVCGSRSPPASPAAFAAFAHAVAERYGRRGSFWRAHPGLPYEPVIDYEIWNSPNYGYFWCPAPDPRAYGALYAAARTAIHAADPRARVLVGGLGPFRAGGPATPRANMPTAMFLRAMAASAGTKADAIAIHLYGSDPAAVEAQLEWFRAIVDRAGFAGTPLVVNEFGWPTQGTGGPVPVAEPIRASYVEQVTRAIASSDCDVIELALHTWVTAEADPNDAEHWYGVADPASGEAYPTARAYAGQVAAFDGKPAPASSGLCSG